MKELSCNGKHFELFEKQNANDLAYLLKNKYQNPNKNKIFSAAEYASETYSYKRYIYYLTNKYKE